MTEIKVTTYPNKTSTDKIAELVIKGAEYLILMGGYNLQYASKESIEVLKQRGNADDLSYYLKLALELEVLELRTQVAEESLREFINRHNLNKD